MIESNNNLIKGKVNKVKDYWIPNLKIELVDWLAELHPKDRTKFKRMNKKQLYKIYFEIRDKEVKGRDYSYA